MTKKRTPPPGRSGRGAARNCDPPKDHSFPDTVPDRRDQSADNAGGQIEPFTPEGVFTLLRDKVLKGEARLPRPGDPAISDLVRALCWLQRRFRGWTGPWLIELENFRRIDEAIRVLTEILPRHREVYAGIVADFERFGAAQEWAEMEARAQLEAFDALVAAAHAARDVGLPLLQESALALTPRTERWRDFGRELEACFNFALPDRPKEALYRFIVEVTPAITGEHPSVFAVQSEFKRKRLVEPTFEFGPQVHARRAPKKKIVKKGKRPV